MKAKRALVVLASAVLAGGLYAADSASAGAPFSCTTNRFTAFYGGRCGPYTYPLVEGTSSNPYVDQNVWSPITGETQTLQANSPGDWKITNSTPTNPSGAVTAFANTGAPFNEQPLSSFSELIGSFSETMPHTLGTSAWATYDNWFDNGRYEVMIQHDFVGNGPCDYVAVATFGGSNGVPAQLWGLCTYGSELIWKLAAPGSTVGSNQTVNESSGSVDIKAMIQYLVDHAYMDPDPTISNLSYGWEICSTGGSAQTFTVTSYSLTTHPNAGLRPVMTTGSATNGTSSGATVHAVVNPEGAGTAYHFAYGTTTHYGGTSAVGSAGSGTSAVKRSAGITGLAPGTKYHYRVEATNAYGTSYGGDATFTTSSKVGGWLLVGDTSREAAIDGAPAGQAEAFSYRAAASGTSVTASFYVDGSNRATGGRVGVYAGSGWDSPGQRLAQARFTPTPGWNKVTLAGANIVAGRKYWLAVLGIGGQLAFRDQGSGSKDEYSRQLKLTSLPSSWSDGPSWNSGHASFYISG